MKTMSSQLMTKHTEGHCNILSLNVNMLDYCVFQSLDIFYVTTPLIIQKKAWTAYLLEVFPSLERTGTLWKSIYRGEGSREETVTEKIYSPRNVCGESIPFSPQWNASASHFLNKWDNPHEYTSVLHIHQQSLKLLLGSTQKHTGGNHSLYGSASQETVQVQSTFALKCISNYFKSHIRFSD